MDLSSRFGARATLLPPGISPPQKTHLFEGVSSSREKSVLQSEPANCPSLSRQLWPGAYGRASTHWGGDFRVRVTLARDRQLS